jgi:hypothetical protein
LKELDREPVRCSRNWRTKMSILVTLCEFAAVVALIVGFANEPKVVEWETAVAEKVINFIVNLH